MQNYIFYSSLSILPLNIQTKFFNVFLYTHTLLEVKGVFKNAFTVFYIPFCNIKYSNNNLAVVCISIIKDSYIKLFMYIYIKYLSSPPVPKILIFFNWLFYVCYHFYTDSENQIDFKSKLILNKKPTIFISFNDSIVICYFTIHWNVFTITTDKIAKLSEK